MKAARNALKGYTYQNYIFTLMLAKMDAERKIQKIESEVSDTKNFDDIYIKLSSGDEYRLQVKNYKDISIRDIQVDSAKHEVKIRKNQNQYDENDNNVFVVNSDLDVMCDSEFMGIPAIKVEGIFVVPIAENRISKMIDNLYQYRERGRQILYYGYHFTSSGKFEVTEKDLPPLVSLSMDMDQRTILIRQVPKDLVVDGIHYIEGKPGVGKSHFVNEITDTYKDAIVYRFWIGAQDAHLNYRLDFEVFIEQLGLIAFRSPKSFSIEELIDRLYSLNKIVIIDGLDHIENYNQEELDKYIDFLDKLDAKRIRVLLLSRPLKKKVNWKKTSLTDWTFAETKGYLAKAYSITEYEQQKAIFNVSKGYPIITHYLAAHFLKYGKLNIETEIGSIFGYYDALIKDVRTRSVLGFFASNNSFFTYKEIQDAVDGVTYDIIKDFIDDYPYLFVITVNRVSLVHDSFNTYLRQQKGSSHWLDKIINKVSDQILNGEIEFMARFSSFHFDESVIQSVLKKYSDFGMFERLLRNTVDFNSISSFYEQLQKLLEIRPHVLDIYQYYSFILIFQLLTRTDLVGSEDMIFQILYYIKLHSDDIENQIFSSDIMWQVYLAAFQNQQDNLKRYLNNSLYGDDHYREVCELLHEERDFFECLRDDQDALDLLGKANTIKNDLSIQSDYLQRYLVKAWIQQNQELPLFNEFQAYIEDGREDLIAKAIKSKFYYDDYWVDRIYISARNRLHELGLFGEKNKYRYKTIQELIKELAPKGSLNVEQEVLSTLRLSNYEHRSIDVLEMNYFWCMYVQQRDISVITIGTALCTFERAGMIDEDDSLHIIFRLMEQSEMLIRDLLASYINEKGQEYVQRLVNTGKIYELDSQLDYFNLNPENINWLPKSVITKRLFDSSGYYRRRAYLYGDEIKNALCSKYEKYICDILVTDGMKVRGGLQKREIDILKGYGIEYVEDSGFTKNEEYIPFRCGYISRLDFDYIKNHKMSLMECSRYTDGFYTCLPYVDLYELFDINEVRDKYLSILHQAIFAKIEEGKVGSWKSLLGNIPGFLEKYGIDADMNRLFRIFLMFLDASSIFCPERVKATLEKM